MKEKLTIKDLERILLDNFVNEHGNLDISGLDFRDFNGDVIIRQMKVKGNLYQTYQEVGGDLYQDSQTVIGKLYQTYQEVGGDLYQDNQTVIGKLIQDCSCEKEIQLPTYPTAEIKSKMQRQLEKELVKKDPIRRLVDLGFMVHKDEKIMVGPFEISKNGVNVSSHINGTMSEDILEALLDLVRELKELEK